MRAFQLLGYQLPTDPPADDAADPPGLRRVLGGWCRTSDKFADVDSACKVPSHTQTPSEMFVSLTTRTGLARCRVLRYTCRLACPFVRPCLLTSTASSRGVLNLMYADLGLR